MSEHAKRLEVPEPRPSRLDLLKGELARRELTRRSMRYYVSQIQPDFIFDPFQEDLFARLQRFVRRVEAKQSPRLMLTMPPRSGKSITASVRLPEWLLGRNPGCEVIIASYSADLAAVWSRQIRQTLTGEEYRALYPSVELDPATRAAEYWRLTEGGGVRAAGVGGGVTGMGADTLILDDLFKNLEEADNQNTRDKIWDWFMSVAMTRLSPGAGIIAIGTRWHFDDVLGRLQEGEDDYEVVDYPALAEEYEYIDETTLEVTRSTEERKAPGLKLFRSPGEPLSPSRYDRDALLRIKANLSPRIWSALYQQRPVPETGSFFSEDDFRYIPTTPRTPHSTVVCAWDFAISKTTSADYTVGATLIRTPNGYVTLAHLLRARMDAYEIVQAILRESTREANTVLVVEKDKIWMTLKPLVLEAARDAGIALRFREMKIRSDKETRARTTQSLMRQRRLFLRADQPWLPALKQEMLQFPAGRHDDQVDAISWGLLALNDIPMTRGASNAKRRKLRPYSATEQSSGGWMSA